MTSPAIHEREPDQAVQADGDRDPLLAEDSRDTTAVPVAVKHPRFGLGILSRMNITAGGAFWVLLVLGFLVALPLYYDNKSSSPGISTPGSAQDLWDQHSSKEDAVRAGEPAVRAQGPLSTGKYAAGAGGERSRLEILSAAAGAAGAQDPLSTTSDEQAAGVGEQAAGIGKQDAEDAALMPRSGWSAEESAERGEKLSRASPSSVLEKPSRQTSSVLENSSSIASAVLWTARKQKGAGPSKNDRYKMGKENLHNEDNCDLSFLEQMLL